MLGPIEIRHNLRQWIAKNFQLGAEDVLVDELGFVNKSPASTVDSSYRADLALANGRLVGFEIKSGADSLKRWPDQCKAYHRVFDEVWLCAHGKHLEKALAMTPKETGVMLVDDFGGIAVLREARRHGRLDSYDLTGLLWREELEELCSDNFVKFRSRDTKSELRTLVSRELDLDVIKKFVLLRLKARKSD